MHILSHGNIWKTISDNIIQCNMLKFSVIITVQIPWKPKKWRCIPHAWHRPTVCTYWVLYSRACLLLGSDIERSHHSTCYSTLNSLVIILHLVNLSSLFCHIYDLNICQSINVVSFVCKYFTSFDIVFSWLVGDSCASIVKYMYGIVFSTRGRYRFWISCNNTLIKSSMLQHV